MRVSASITRPHAVGDQIALDDLDAIHAIELTDLDPNAGHITLVLYRGQWYLAFDLRYNTRTSREHVAGARQFLNSAARSLEAGEMRPLVVDLFAAAENMARAELQMHDQSMATGRDHTGRRLANLHRERRDRYARWAKLGNTDERYSALLSYLYALRPTAQYHEPGSLPSVEEAREMLATAEAMYAHVEARLNA